jgi:hypothetical protein
MNRLHRHCRGSSAMHLAHHAYVLKLFKELATSLPRTPENDIIIFRKKIIIIIFTKSLSQEAKTGMKICQEYSTNFKK